MVNPETVIKLEVIHLRNLTRGGQGLIPDTEGQPPGIINPIPKTGDLCLDLGTEDPNQSLGADIRKDLQQGITVTLTLQLPNVHIHIPVLVPEDVNHLK